MYAIAYQVSKSGSLAYRFLSSDGLVSIMVANSLGIPPPRTSSTRVSTIVSIRAVVVKYNFSYNIDGAIWRVG